MKLCDWLPGFEGVTYHDQHFTRTEQEQHEQHCMKHKTNKEHHCLNFNYGTEVAEKNALHHCFPIAQLDVTILLAQRFRLYRR